MAVPPDDAARQQATVTFLTTEHFTLQGARSAAVAETNSRLQIYMGVLSSSIVALALVAQVSRLGSVFFAFALVILPIVYLLGLATIGRLNQSWDDWFRAGQGMNRIRRYFVEVAPEIEPYLIMPTSDDPWATLRGVGIPETKWWSGFVTAFAVVAMLNSVVAGVIAGLVGTVLTDYGALVPAVLSAVAFTLSEGLFIAFGRRRFLRKLAFSDVRFPPPGDSSESMPGS